MSPTCRRPWPGPCSTRSANRLPRNAYYGDGSPIEAEVLDTIRAAYREETRAFAWERGDVLMLDNFISVHGREPYTGERKVLVAMTDLHVHQP